MDYPRYAQRRERLAPLLTDEGIDALMISSPVNVTYLTGFSGDSTVLLLTRDRALVVSDSRYTGQLADECPQLLTHIRPPSQKLPEAVAEALHRLGVRSVGFETAAVTVAEFEFLRERTPSLNWKGGADRVERLRMVKDAWELAQIRTAIEVAERAFTAFRALLRPEDTEKDLCDAIEHYARRAGAAGTAFPPIVAVGERAALPHAPPTNRTVASGELLLVDWGVSAPLYKSDLTRVLDTRTTSTFSSAAASTTAKLEEVYAVVLRAQEAALRAVRPGVSTRDIDTAARSVIAEAGYGDCFGHGLGHGFGLQIHEAPWLRPNSETPIEAGMIFTLEPGIYLPGWGGIRIEDDVLVTPDGVERLTHLSRDLDAMRAFA
ncbi:MAG TPA: Xaa-Pro peptidase family protein [Gemmataceae bacterium]|nr:Xaa-Pro peptidase family protein [Gemmataceae bacterium]